MNAPQKKDQAVPDKPTARLAELISGVTYESLDDSVITTVKRLVLDGIAVAMAGTHEEPPRIMADYVREVGAAPKSSVWGFNFKTSPALAAYNNAVSMHVLDFEPMSNPPTHAVSPTLPGVLALAESRAMDGKAIVAACAKGFEMQGRLLIAGSLERGSFLFHTPGVVGLLGSAVGASHLLGLSATQLANALGIAASRCSGLSANTGSMVKCTHPGNAAMAGVEAALLAQRGLTSHPGILEAEEGYVATFFKQHFDYDALFQYGKPYRLVDPGMAIKFYPSKYPTQFGIAAALALQPKIGNVANIKQVRILTPEIEDADRPKPRSGLEGKFSFQYTVSTALVDGKVGVGSFTDELRFRPAIIDLLDKTTVERNRELSRDTRKLRVEVEVTMKDGTVHREVCTKPPGFWGEPVDAKLHQAKIADCLSVRMGDETIKRTLDLLNRLERLSGQEVGSLMALLADPK